VEGQNIWVQVALNGLVMASYYCLIASGLTLVFGVMKVMNFAHGEVYMLGAFGCYFLFASWGFNYFLTLVLVILGTFILGLVLEILVFRPLRMQPWAAFLASIGVLLIISTVAANVFGSDVRGVPSVFHGTVHVLGGTLSWERVAILPMTAVIMLILVILLYRTRTGMSMRATSEDIDAAALQGVKINNMSALALGLGSALAGVAGGIMAPVLFVQPTMDFPAVLKASVVVILGGLGSLRGAAIAAVIIGFSESITQTWIGGWAVLTGWVIVAVVLLFRPMGLFGREEW
jgi:branched-chain amino acid transport system permease protein